MSLATIRESPGLDAYLEGLEERLAAAVEACPGLVATVGAEALAAGGKRLRPLLVFLTAPKDTDPLPAGAAVELVHTATLVHDDLIDRAEYRRGRASAWACHGPAAARAASDRHLVAHLPRRRVRSLPRRLPMKSGCSWLRFSE